MFYLRIAESSPGAKGGITQDVRTRRQESLRANFRRCQSHPYFLSPAWEYGFAGAYTLTFTIHIVEADKSYKEIVKSESES